VEATWLECHKNINIGRDLSSRLLVHAVGAGKNVKKIVFVFEFTTSYSILFKTCFKQLRIRSCFILF